MIGFISYPTFIAPSFSNNFKSYYLNNSDTLSLINKLDQACDFLISYLQKESITGNEGPAGLFFSEYCSEQGLHVNYFSEKIDSYNFSASLFPLSLGKPNIIFLSHIDVVPPGETLSWNHPPFSGAVQDGYIYGRGAIDSKGLATMQLMALLELKEKHSGEDLPYNVTLLVVSNEEDGGVKGSQIITKNHIKFLNPVVILGEGGSGMNGVLSSKPTSNVFGVSIAEKYNVWLKLELKQLSNGHGATPSLNYANKVMIGALNRINNRKIKLKFNKSNRAMFRKLGEIEGGLRGFFIKKINWGILNPFVKNFVKSDPLYLSLVTNTVTVTNLYNPPGPPNQIADHSVAILDCRLLPGTNKKAFVRHINHIINEPNIDITIIGESPDSEPTKLDNSYKALVKAIKTHNPDSYVVPILFPATTDNSFFRHENIPVYGLIPSVLDAQSIQSIHSVNERISLKELTMGMEIYSLFLDNMIQIKPKPSILK
ncbi:MAG: M20/M25/M40 family metallo-hydrolase [Bacteroidota bacterium]|nr:M20/M25/M40 family metallo-hydrolase [Bacteroidota bacterium]